ncbi:MAG: hypothetical protein LBN94_00265 [Puniceicoccales bacterium]|nr:hypothetical protein [Puniceicoccales bacterium]
MKKGKYLIFGLFPLAISAALLQGTSATQNATGTTINDTGMGDMFMALDEEQNIVESVNLNNADPREVIGCLEKLTGRTALIEQKLPTAKISMNIPHSTARLEAIAALESVLSLNGIAVVDMGDNFIKIVTSKSAVTQSPEIFDESLLAYAPNQKIASKFFTLRYLDVTEFQKSIKSILTPNSSNIILFPSSNSIFITDTMANLRNVETLILRTDTPIQMTETVNFIPFNNVKASAIAKKFEQLKRGTLKKYLSSVTIDCDDSSNQLIVITPPENFSIIRDIAKQLDNRCELLLRSEILRIKHGDAKKITEIVSGIVKEQRSRAEKENQMAFERQQIQMAAQGNLAHALAQAASGSRSNQQISNSYSDFISTQQIPGELGEEQSAQFSANLTLAPDERSNSIIVYGTASDLAQIRTLITNLDVLLDQVRIEVIVAQVTLGEGQQSGLDSLNLGFNQNKAYDIYSASSGGDGGGSQSAGRPYEINASGTLGGSTSFNGTLKKFALASVLSQAKTNSNVKILSTPTLVTTHNRKAQFKIGEERPFVDSSTKGDSSDSKERINFVYKHVGIELTVTPLIGSNGIIQMEIEQKISKYTDEAKTGAGNAPVISDKQINSFVSVANEDVIVLAGFKEKETSKIGGKLFLLGDLPILGNLLFSPKKRAEKTQELVIFIKPTIILHPQEEAAYLNKRLEVTNFKEDIEHYRATGKFPESEPFPKNTFGVNVKEREHGSNPQPRHRHDQPRDRGNGDQRKAKRRERHSTSLSQYFRKRSKKSNAVNSPTGGNEIFPDSDKRIAVPTKSTSKKHHRRM